ncbi:MAG: thioesterase family protein [Flavobacteriales bacterium]|nr:thioesterase family protein [Flavobacteriales bacterium]
MARIKLDAPGKIHFTTRIKVRITDLNYGNHLGNDALLSLIHQARIEFLQNYGYTEQNIEGVGLIMSDVGIQFKNEAFAGDILIFEMTAYDFMPTSFDLFYCILRESDQKLIALAKTNMVFFDYTVRKVQEVPLSFASLFAS